MESSAAVQAAGGLAPGREWLRLAPMRPLFLLIAWLALATVTPHRPVPVVPPPAVAWVRFEPGALDAADPRRTALGPFIYLGGWALSSNDPRFGGLSALHVERGAVLAFSASG